jgi:hypothetical protein
MTGARTRRFLPSRSPGVAFPRPHFCHVTEYASGFGPVLPIARQHLRLSLQPHWTLQHTRATAMLRSLVVGDRLLRTAPDAVAALHRVEPSTLSCLRSAATLNSSSANATSGTIRAGPATLGTKPRSDGRCGLSERSGMTQVDEAVGLVDQW